METISVQERTLTGYRGESGTTSAGRSRLPGEGRDPVKKIRYLAYGSNLHPARIGTRLASVRLLGISKLPGWTLRFHKSSTDGSGKCNLIANPTCVAYGAVYEISITDKRRLDTIEGVGNGYSDTPIELPAFGQAWVYLAEPGHTDDRLAPYDWYRAFVVGGARYHRMPASYIAQISRTTTRRDPDRERRTRNLEILNSTAFPRLRRE